MDRRRAGRKRKGRIRKYIILWVLFGLVAAGLVALAILLFPGKDDTLDTLLEQDPSIEYIEERPLYVPRPDIDVQLLTVNEYSRPGIQTDGIENIVIHYLANPGTTAQQNHDYFESLKDLKNTYMSANYVVGLEGEIIQCVPDDEIAYASNNKNSTSISIENCHEDESGRFTQETYDSLVKLTAYLSEKYDLGRDDIIRHYDVTGKMCPLYFVEHEDKWEEFKDDVIAYREQCAQERRAQEQDTEDELAAYLEAVD